MFSFFVLLAFGCSFAKLYKREQTIGVSYDVTEFDLTILNASQILNGSGVYTDQLKLPPEVKNLFNLRLHSLINASNANYLELWLEGEGKAASGTLYLNTYAAHHRSNDSAVFSFTGVDYFEVSTHPPVSPSNF